MLQTSFLAALFLCLFSQHCSLLPFHVKGGGLISSLGGLKGQSCSPPPIPGGSVLISYRLLFLN
jgi:hypothetical protein